MCNISKTINQTLVFRQPTYSRYGLIGVKCSISSQCQYIISIPIHIFDIVGGFKIINLVREISTNQYCPPSAYLPILTINTQPLYYIFLLCIFAMRKMFSAIRILTFTLLQVVHIFYLHVLHISLPSISKLPSTINILYYALLLRFCTLGQNCFSYK